MTQKYNVNKKTVYVPKHMADATLSQANPVSTTLYTVLDTTKNVRIISITARITWATTQPTPLRVIVTIDGVTLTMDKVDPVSATDYAMNLNNPEAADSWILSTTFPTTYKPFELEGRSVKVQIRITWATTQPTPLVCRVKYAKW